MKKKIILGITSSIAAYKAADIIRGLVKENYDVHPVATEHALNFITPLTLETLSGNKISTDESLWKNREMAHIDLKEEAALLLIAPATANILGKCAQGIADDLLSTTYLSVTCPVLMAPAMNPNMYGHPAVVGNIDTLKKRGVYFVDPGAGDVICGDTGQGRLASVEDIIASALEILNK